MTVRNLSERSPFGPGVHQDPPRAGSGRVGTGRVVREGLDASSSLTPLTATSTEDVEREGVAREDFGSWLVWTDELEHIDREGRLLAERLAYLRERRRQVKRALADLSMDERRAA